MKLTWVKGAIVASVVMGLFVGSTVVAESAAAAPTAPGKIKYGSATMASCAKKTIKSGDKGNCGKVLQKRLKDLGFYAGSIDGIVGTGTLNGVLNYQRSQHLADDAIVGSATWTRLRQDPQPAVKDIVPKGCYSDGKVACVSKATRKATFYRDGKKVKTISVRLGGWTDDRTGKMRVHQTVKGTYRVFKKDPNPTSPRYGEGAMPLSVMFDPNMYFHYSAGFASDGYMASSHGCVNIGSKKDAQWVYDFMRVGNKVIVY